MPSRCTKTFQKTPHFILTSSRHTLVAIAVSYTFSVISTRSPVAHTNLALTYISQGWWTDAYREIDQLLARPMENPFHNRLRITKGLSQLQQGFSRDARKTFRSVDRDSRYTGNAWLGIGLAALHLNDHRSEGHTSERQSRGR